MNDMLTYTEYETAMDSGTYKPGKDFFGPMFFNPINCQDQENKKKIAKENDQAED